MTTIRAKQWAFQILTIQNLLFVILTAALAAVEHAGLELAQELQPLMDLHSRLLEQIFITLKTESMHMCGNSKIKPMVSYSPPPLYYKV